MNVKVNYQANFSGLNKREEEKKKNKIIDKINNDRNSRNLHKKYLYVLCCMTDKVSCIQGDLLKDLTSEKSAICLK